MLSSNSKQTNNKNQQQQKNLQKIKITSPLEAIESLPVPEYPDLADTAGSGGVNSSFPHSPISVTDEDGKIKSAKVPKYSAPLLLYPRTLTTICHTHVTPPEH